MIRIIADGSLPYLTDCFDHQNIMLTRYHSLHDLKAHIKNQDVLLCRANLHVHEGLINESKIKAVATASSGSDHIEHAPLLEQDITILDAKGCNAVSVGDYVLACLAHLNQKKMLLGNKLGLIGYGEVGRRLYERLVALNFEVLIVDPFKAPDYPHLPFVELDALKSCDIISIHANYHTAPPHGTHHLISYAFLKRLKPGAIMINAARGKIVDEKALLALPPHLIYCADVYQHEPQISAPLVKRAEIATPHIAGHSLDAKRNAVYFAAQKIYKQFGLAPLNLETLSPQQGPQLSKCTWDAKILAIYDPAIETNHLKQAHDIETAFLELRKQHPPRRDFEAYQNQK